MSTEMDGEETKDGRGGRTTEDLFVEHYDFMFRAARKSLRKTEDAQDVIQSLYLKLIDSKLPPDVWRDPKGYLYRTRVMTGDGRGKAAGKTGESSSSKSGSPAASTRTKRAPTGLQHHGGRQMHAEFSENRGQAPGRSARGF
ncbi:MAG TPA: hypothetical protein VGK48_12565 [Terriglobia bacterium]|jgi:hypothetical protein